MNALKTVQAKAEDAIRATPVGTKAEVGEELANSFLNKANQMVESYSSKFKELGLTESVIPVNERSVSQIARNIQKIPEVRGGGTPQFAQALEARLQKVKTLEDLTVQIKLINNEIKGFSEKIGGDATAARVANLVKDKLERLYEVTIKRQFSPKDQKYLLDMYKASRREFAQAAQKLGRVAGATGFKNVGSPINFVRLLKDEGKFNADLLVDKLFQKKNTKFLEFFQKEFPKEWDLVKNYQKAQFGEYKDGVLNVSKLIKQYDGLEAEVQKALFTDAERQILEDTKIYTESLPPPPSSPTAPILGWMSFLNKPVEAAFTTARDLAIKAGFEGLEFSAKDAPRAATLSKVMEYAQKTQRAVESGSKAIFNPKTVRGVIGVGSQVLDQDEYHKIIDKVDKAVSNPEDFHSVLDKNTQNLNPYAPKTAFAIQNKMSVAASFLSAKAPRGVKSSVLSPKYQPSKSEINKFARYYNTVKSPTSVLKKIKTGSVLPEEMETLKVVYPQLLAEMQGAIMEQLADHMANAKDLPYQTKLGLSAFLEHDLVNSMGQESVAMNQVTFGAPTMQKEQGLKPTQGGLGKLTANDRFQTGFKKLSAGGEA